MKTKYRFFYCGHWRAVVNMMDRNNVATTRPDRAAKAVLYDDTFGSWVPVVIEHPAEISHDPDYVTTRWGVLTISSLGD